MNILSIICFIVAVVWKQLHVSLPLTMVHSFITFGWTWRSYSTLVSGNNKLTTTFAFLFTLTFISVSLHTLFITELLTILPTLSTSLHMFYNTQYDKFGPVYLQLAEEHGVRFDNVVLSLRDNILSHDQTPNDVQLSIVDIVGE